jgi:hypothetical protein
MLSHSPLLKQDPSTKKANYLIPGYFASPIDLYLGSRIYAPALAVAKTQFPNIYFIEPALKNWTNEQWLKDWVQIAPNLGLITVLPRLDRSIGKGCYKEITDSITLGIPIYIFDHQEKEFAPFKKQILFPFISRSYPQFARVYFHAPEKDE